MILDFKFGFAYGRKTLQGNMVNGKNIMLLIVEYGKFDGDVHFFCVGPKTCFLGKFGPKIQTCFFFKNILVLRLLVFRFGNSF